MKKLELENRKVLLTCIMLMLHVNVWSFFMFTSNILEKDVEVDPEGLWPEKGKSIISVPISIYQNSQYLTIQDSNPVNTITVRITRNDSGATVFENVYPQGQTGLIAIPLQGWSAGSYTIELFGRENNGYLVGTFQILP